MAMSERVRVALLCPDYLPGIGGGVIQAMASVVEALGDAVDFTVVTGNRDRGLSTPYVSGGPVVRRRVGKADVTYLAPRGRLPWTLLSVVRAARPDALYLGSVFSPPFAIVILLARRLGLLPSVRTLVIAPRGELASEAVRHSRWKKRPWLWVARNAGLFTGAIWQATHEGEVDQIRACVGDAATIRLVRDPLPSLAAFGDVERVRAKRRGELSVLFLARIAPIKNLMYLLRSAARVHGSVEIDVCGPVDDAPYWAECLALARTLPEHVTVRHLGALPHERVPQAMADHDLFVLPTLGESFGYAILEAISSGCPVLISDRTPWRDLATAGAGWAVPLDDTAAFDRVLQHCVDMDESERQVLSRRAWLYSEHVRGAASGCEGLAALFGGRACAS